MKRVPLSFTKEDAADRWMNIHLLASSMNKNLELEGKKANWFDFLEINEWTWNHRSILWSTRLREESYFLLTQCCSDWISKISLPYWKGAKRFFEVFSCPCHLRESQLATAISVVVWRFIRQRRACWLPIDSTRKDNSTGGRRVICPLFRSTRAACLSCVTTLQSEWLF